MASFPPTEWCVSAFSPSSRKHALTVPIDAQEELPEEPPRSASAVPTPSSDAEMEAELFAKSASIDQLLTLMKNSSARGENLADNDELAVSRGGRFRFLPRRIAADSPSRRAGSLQRVHGAGAKGRQPHPQVRSEAG